jgi:hypothetical protein
MAFCSRATKLLFVGLETTRYLIWEIKMIKIATTLAVALTLVFSSNFVFADTIIETYTCELKDIFEGVSDCSENRLWKFKPTK